MILVYFPNDYFVTCIDTFRVLCANLECLPPTIGSIDCCPPNRRILPRAWSACIRVATRAHMSSHFPRLRPTPSPPLRFSSMPIISTMPTACTSSYGCWDQRVKITLFSSWSFALCRERHGVSTGPLIAKWLRHHTYVQLARHYG